MHFNQKTNIEKRNTKKIEKSYVWKYLYEKILNRDYRLGKKKDIKAIGGVVAPDEEFRSVDGVGGIWVSNYARVLSKRSGEARLLTPQFEDGYYRIVLDRIKNGRRKAKTYRIHKWIAEAFCEVPEWIREEDMDNLIVHHKNPVSKDNTDISLHFPGNLMFLPKQLHPVFENIKLIEVRNDNSWTALDIPKAAAVVGLDPYDLCEIIRNKKKCPPDRIEGDYWYYNIDSHEIRIIRK